MIEETIFTSEKIKSWQCYLYSINENKYILKGFQTKHTKEEINKKINIINYLKKDNIPVPEYIKTITGEYILSMKTKL